MVGTDVAISGIVIEERMLAIIGAVLQFAIVVFAVVLTVVFAVEMAASLDGSHASF